MKSSSSQDHARHQSWLSSPRSNTVTFPIQTQRNNLRANIFPIILRDARIAALQIAIQRRSVKRLLCGGLIHPRRDKTSSYASASVARVPVELKAGLHAI